MQMGKATGPVNVPSFCPLPFFWPPRRHWCLKWHGLRENLIWWKIIFSILAEREGCGWFAGLTQPTNADGESDRSREYPFPSALCPSFDRGGSIDVWDDMFKGRIWFGGKSCFESFGLSNERNNCGWMKKYSTNLKPGACKCSNQFGKRIWRGDGKLQFE